MFKTDLCLVFIRFEIEILEDVFVVDDKLVESLKQLLLVQWIRILAEVPFDGQQS